MKDAFKLVFVMTVVLFPTCTTAEIVCPQNDDVTCLEVAQRQNGQSMMGGWLQHNIHDLKDQQGYVNNIVNNMLKGCKGDVIKNVPVQLLEVYTQVVSGTNYCINLQVQGGNCVIQAYQPLPNSGDSNSEIKATCSY